MDIPSLNKTFQYILMILEQGELEELWELTAEFSLDGCLGLKANQGWLCSHTPRSCGKMDRPWLLKMLDDWDPGIKGQKQNSRTDAGGPAGRAGQWLTARAEESQAYRASWVSLEVGEHCGYE